jgi:hypothetical protein
MGTLGFGYLDGMVAHGAGAANNQQRLTGDCTVKGDGALRREEWNPKASLSSAKIVWPHRTVNGAL